ncbi:unnamed protein product [Notodromas monacha]|uniref:Uncharacterized protein n=1 Tax=Notodromas monacha TaxID=399045 RepID=A0A7R9BSZ0_9CRUS|nr:unnamed protein product [Notodromas monacha]CAG0920118.1 unnamed protein product [Notodromas monacha]
MNNGDYLRALLVDLFKNLQTEHADILAALQECLKEPNWEKEVGNPRLTSKLLKTAIHRCGRSESLLFAVLELFKQYAENISKSLKLAVLSDLGSVLLQTSNPKLWMNYAAVMKIWWDEIKLPDLDTKDDLVKAYKALENLLSCDDMENTKVGVSLLRELHSKFPDDVSLKGMILKTVQSSTVFNKLSGKAKKLYAPESDLEDIEAIVTVWKTLFEILGEETLNARVSNQFLSVIDSLRSSRLLNPTLGCRIMGAYVELSSAETLNESRRQKLLGATFKTLRPRNEFENEEFKNLVVAVGRKTSFDALDEIIVQYPKEWADYVANWAHLHAQRICEKAFGPIEWNEFGKLGQKSSESVKFVHMLNHVVGSVDFGTKKQGELYLWLLVKGCELIASEKSVVPIGMKPIGTMVIVLLVQTLELVKEHVGSEDYSDVMAPLIRAFPRMPNHYELHESEWEEVRRLTENIVSSGGLKAQEKQELMKTLGSLHCAVDDNHDEPFTDSLPEAPKAGMFVQKKLKFGDVIAEKAIPTDLKNNAPGLLFGDSHREIGGNAHRASNKKEAKDDFPSEVGRLSVRKAAGKMVKNTEEENFVVINTPLRNRRGPLTEHQKEVLSARKCDIPAMYCDLSQQSMQPGYLDSDSVQEGGDAKKSVSMSAKPFDEFEDEYARSSPLTIQAKQEADASLPDEASDGDDCIFEKVVIVEKKGKQSRKPAEPKRFDRAAKKRKCPSDSSHSAEKVSKLKLKIAVSQPLPSMDEEDVVLDSQEILKRSPKRSSRSIQRFNSDPAWEKRARAEKTEKINFCAIESNGANPSPDQPVEEEESPKEKEVPGEALEGILKNVEKTTSNQNKKGRVSFNPVVEEAVFKQIASSESAQSVAESQENASGDHVENPTVVYEDTPIEPSIQGEEDEIVDSTLIDSEQSVTSLLKFLTPPTWVETFGDKLDDMGVKTIGDFCALKKFQLKSLPIAGKTAGVLTTVREGIRKWKLALEQEQEEADFDIPDPPKLSSTSSVESMEVVEEKSDHESSVANEKRPESAFVESLVQLAEAKDMIRPIDAAVELYQKLKDVDDCWRIFSYLGTFQSKLAEMAISKKN